MLRSVLVVFFSFFGNSGFYSILKKKQLSDRSFGIFLKNVTSFCFAIFFEIKAPLVLLE